jgi:hypothetical protein
MEMQYDKDMIEVVEMLSKGNDDIAIKNQRILSVLNALSFEKVKKYYMKRKRKIDEVTVDKVTVKEVTVKEVTVKEVTAAVISLASSTSLEELERIVHEEM